MSIKKKEYLSPLQSLDFYLPHFNALCKKLKLESDISGVQKILNRDVDLYVINILRSNRYEALVMTNKKQKIVWANNGFHEMTGYTKRFARNKKPSFLQGKNTSEEVKEKIRKQILQEKRFTASIVNYRKNGEEYLCRIDVIPLFNSKKKLTHFLAMEREQKVA